MFSLFLEYSHFFSGFMEFSTFSRPDLSCVRVSVFLRPIAPLKNFLCKLSVFARLIIIEQFFSKLAENTIFFHCIINQLQTLLIRYIINQVKVWYNKCTLYIVYSVHLNS